MIQRHIPGTSDTWAQCPCCGQLPRLIECRGHARSEGINFALPTTRYMLECRCGRTTSRHASISQAEQEWGVRHDQVSLPLHQPSRVTKLRPRGRR